MLKVFSSMEMNEAVLVRAALAHRGIEARTLNEFSGGSAVPEFRPPVEVWISHDADYEAARHLVAETIATLDSRSEGPDWTCANCKTENPATFELCWSCGQARA